MSPTLAAELAVCLQFAAAAIKALPIDEEMDRLATAALNRRPPGWAPRKLTRKP